MQRKRLSNGVEMPMEGFGVFQISNLDECRRVVLDALETGYRTIDTAAVYSNERAVGTAIRESGIPREELFITTKVWIDETGYEQTKQSFAASLERLGLEYLDLYLVHMPFGDYYGSWRAMEELYAQGKVRAIGVSNFYPARLMDLCRHAKVLPVVNQVECHPLSQQKEALAVMAELGVAMEAWSPFAEGKQGIFTHPVLSAIGAKYGKTVAQVILRWNVQRGVAVIPKSVHKARMEENFAIWDFELTTEDMAAIAALDQSRGLMLDVFSADEVKRLYGIVTTN